MHALLEFASQLCVVIVVLTFIFIFNNLFVYSSQLSFDFIIRIVDLD